jgi:Zn-dependent protease with chaperone function
MMKIYLQKNGEKSGPFSAEELREKTYSGEVPRSISACTDEALEWVPLETLLSQREKPSSPAPPLPDQGRSPKTTAAVSTIAERLRDPKEKTALVLLYIAAVPVWLLLAAWSVIERGIPLVIIGVVWACIAIGEMLFAAYLKANAVRVSATQLPDVCRVVNVCCQRLGMETPDVYVMQHNVWNAFATKIFGRRMVVLLSGAVDSILLKGDMQQLTWLVGHELGHHWAGHLSLSQKLAKAGGWLIWVNLWRSRRAELTCDRVGLYCAGSLKASQLALVNATVGAQLAGKVNVTEAVNQWRQHRGEFFVRYRTLYATHPHLLARLDHLNAGSGIWDGRLRLSGQGQPLVFCVSPWGFCGSGMKGKAAKFFYRQLKRTTMGGSPFRRSTDFLFQKILKLSLAINLTFA